MYSAIADADISSKYVTKIRKALRSDPHCMGRSALHKGSYHPGDVWKAILHYGDAQLQEIISDCNY